LADDHSKLERHLIVNNALKFRKQDADITQAAHKDNMMQVTEGRWQVDLCITIHKNHAITFSRLFSIFSNILLSVMAGIKD
jgi:uncharacterized protein YueI